MSSYASTADVLEAALKLIRFKKNWCKYHMLRRRKVRGKMCRQRCASGALHAVPGCYNRHLAVEALVKARPARWRDRYPNGSVTGYNDADETTHEHVVAWFKRAIRLAKREYK